MESHAQSCPIKGSYYSSSTFLISAFQDSTCQGNGYGALLPSKAASSGFGMPIITSVLLKVIGD